MTSKTIVSETFIIGSVSFRMIKIRSGIFLMGNDNGNIDEKPIHQVRLDNYMLGQLPVSQALWYEVMKETDRATPARFQGANRPVEQVSWNDAVIFCNKLSELSDKPLAYDSKGNHVDKNKTPTSDITKIKGFRLPTEAEWEYAAIGGHWAEQKDGCFTKSYEYAGSNRIDDVAWYKNNSHQETKDVGLKLPNQLGLYDMSGNVLELCWDRDGRKYYQECHRRDVVSNPLGGDGSYRMCRGGSWGHAFEYCYVSHRYNLLPHIRSHQIGFRLAFTSR